MWLLVGIFAASSPLLSAKRPGLNDLELTLAGGGAVVTDKIEVEPLATIVPIPSVVLRKVTLQIQSAVPVFPAADGQTPGQLAVLARFNEEVWKTLSTHGGAITCESGVGTQKATHKVSFHGGRSSAAYKSHLVAYCPLPASAYTERCHTISLLEAGVVVGHVRGCQADSTKSEPPVLAQQRSTTASYRSSLGSKKLRVAACVKPLYHAEGDPKKSGLLKLPQWLEFAHMQGVEHFLIYTFGKQYPRDRAVILETARPYLEAGAASIVDIELANYHHSDAQHGAHDLVVNDCLHRMKHNTEWLMPSIDVDEYLTSKTSGDTASLRQIISEHVPMHSQWHSVSFGRYDFQLPQDPYSELDISSQLRPSELAPLCPKYMVRPDRAHTLFIHWVAEPVDPAEKSLYLPPHQLVGFHYRQVKPLENATVDAFLARHEEVLRQHLGALRGQSVPEVLQRIHAELSPQRGHAVPSSLGHSVPVWQRILLEMQKNSQDSASVGLLGDDLREELLAAQFPRFVNRLRHLEEATTLDAPDAPERRPRWTRQRRSKHRSSRGR